MKKIINSKGYTLIEMLAVIIVVVTVSGIITGIIISSLRGSNRSKNVNDVRQVGNFVLSQMFKMINYSESFNGVSEDSSNQILPSITDCTDSGSTLYKYLQIKNFDGGTTTFYCTGITIASSSADTWVKATIISPQNSVNLIDNDSQSGYTVSPCSFTCLQESSSVNPSITIKFTITKNTSSNFAENKVSIPFQTTINFQNSGN